MSQFDQYISDSDAVISKAGTDLETATNDLSAGSITKDEYKELCGDILDETSLATLITDMIRLQKIYDAFKDLATIVGDISSL